MLPRTKSIFNIEEEYSNKTSRVLLMNPRGGPTANLVGLRILIHHHPPASSIVIKSALQSCGLSIGRSGRSPKSTLPELGFLKECFSCKKELSLEKDVYMYRGDQGFCSVECRCRQILLDERREFEASKREWQTTHRHHNAIHKIPESGRRRRITLIGT